MSAWNGRPLARRLGEVAVTLLAVALLAGAWFALFSFVPLELGAPRFR